ncbi:MAG TPA: type IV pili twitching motility protein PilT, partial [Polyangiaceae bacterium]|nr:type IV pili twitching motility protein PilT [Polyangiaceae bacterium]
MPDIELLFDALIAAGGSDLHLGAGYPPMMRLRGELVAMREAPIDAAEMESLCMGIVTSEQRTTIR